jgi:hypothetical protein
MGDVAASLSDAAGEIDNPEIAGLLPELQRDSRTPRTPSARA